MALPDYIDNDRHKLEAVLKELILSDRTSLELARYYASCDRSLKVYKQSQKTQIMIEKTYPDWLRALSIKPLYAWEIIQGYKDEEYRTWKTKNREIFLIHASRGNDTDDVLIEHYGLQLADIDKLRGAIIGASTITDCVPTEYEGEWAFTLREIVAFPNPFKCKGRLNFWQPNTDEQIAAFNKAWKLLVQLKVI